MDHQNNSLSSSNSSDFGTVFTNDILPAVYLALFVLGLVLNSVAAWVFFSVPSDSALVVYLKNMLTADLLMLCSYPLKLIARLAVGGWMVHVVICRYSAVLFYSSMYVGIMFMGLISLERYIKIVRHSQSSTSQLLSLFRSVSLVHFLQSAVCSKVVAVCTWGLMLFSSLPNVILTSQPANEENSRQCMKLKTPLGIQWHKTSTLFSVAMFWLTLVVMAFCYSSIACHVYQSYRRVRSGNNAYRKSNRSILSLLLVFGFCFVPYHICRVPYTLSQVSIGFDANTHFLLFQMKEATLMLAALNVCLDPVIYFLMCRSFREALLQKLPSQERRRSTSTGHSLSNINTAGNCAAP